MSINLPYLAAPTTISKALERIRVASTPPRVTQDFVKTKLQIKGGSGDQMTSYLKRIGFVKADGSPSELYVQYRNVKSAATAVAKAIRIAYAPLYDHNEYAHDLSDEDLRGLIVQVTGWAADARNVELTLKCILLLKAQAKFDGTEESGDGVPVEEKKTNSVISALPAASPPLSPGTHFAKKTLGMSLSYTINLNLPPSTDIAVFNAIFKSLKDNLLSAVDEQES